MNSEFINILNQVNKLVETETDSTKVMKETCILINSNLPTYNWVGFYMVSKTEEKMLELGPYVGEHTDHTKIPFGKGICGQTAESEETFLVDDVSKESNYIACSIHVKSEIVVPMFKNNVMIGQIDIDSDTASAFKKEDEIFLKEICSLISRVIN